MILQVSVNRAKYPKRTILGYLGRQLCTSCSQIFQNIDLAHCLIANVILMINEVTFLKNVTTFLNSSIVVAPESNQNICFRTFWSWADIRFIECKSPCGLIVDENSRHYCQYV